MSDVLSAAAAVKRLAERRAQDALHSWVPTARQAPFIECQESEAWFIAANRSGKSDALAAIIASLARFGRTDPRPAYCPSGAVVYDKAVSIWATSLTFPLGRDILQPKLFDNGFVPAGQPHAPFIPPWEIARWTTTDQVLKLKNGSLIGFKSCDQGRDLFQGTGKDMVAFDEAPTYSVYDESTMRVEGGRRMFIRGAVTLLPPEGVIGGVSWLFPKKIQPYLSNQRPAGLVLFGASIYDNPYLLKEEIERLEAKYPEGSPDRRIRLEGEWLPGIGGALAYTAFSRALHVNSALTRDSRDPRLPLLWSLDFNVEPMGTTIWQRIGKVYRGIDELTMEQANLSGLAEEFRRRFPSHNAELWIHGDATGRRRHEQSGRSNYTVLLEHLRGLPYPVVLKVPDQNPSVPDRINAVNLALRGPQGEICVELAPHMVDTIADFEEVLRDSKGGLKKSTNRQDPYCRRTSWTDTVGYMIAWHTPVTYGYGQDARLRKIATPAYAFSGRR